MKNKSIRAICCLVAVVFLFSGCSLLDFFSADSLLRAPKITGENASLQASFEKSVGKDVSLFTPIAGEYRASYIFFDGNSDGVDEAVVFYSLNTNPSVVHMHILARNGEEWYSVSDITGSGTSVYKVDFFNIDNDSSLEIAVLWSMGDSKKEKTLSIYKVSVSSGNTGSIIVSLATVQLADYICFDIDSDSVNELLYFYHNSSDNDNQFGVRLLAYSVDEKTLFPVSDLSLNERIESVLQILYDRCTDGYVLYVDCLLNDGDYFTEIICYDNEKSVMYLPQNENGLICSATERQALKLCEDFNRDGKTDIPMVFFSEDSYTSGRADGTTEQISFVSWQTFSENGLYEIGKYYDNPVDGYLINIESLHEYYYFVYNYSTRSTQVRLKNFDEENNIVFTVKYDKDTAHNSHALHDDKTQKNDYIIAITQKGSELNIDETFVENLIIYR